MLLPPGTKVDGCCLCEVDGLTRPGGGKSRTSTAIPCTQVTFQARDMAESRYIYDQMAVLAPIMLAVTAGTPILKGRLVVRV